VEQKQKYAGIDARKKKLNSMKFREGKCAG
jgi:hypothetical protein